MQSNSAIAKRAGVNRRTVIKAREASGQPVHSAQVKRVGLDGKARRLPTARPPAPKKPAAPTAPFNHQINALVRELSEIVSRWCEVTGRWIDEHRQALDQENGGPSGMTGKACLMQAMQDSANDLLNLAQRLDGR
jgi:hypothetical protein